MPKTKVTIQKCNGYVPDSLEAAIRACVEPLGGFSAFVRPGDRVLLKPNILNNSKPQKAVTTHPTFIAAVARLVTEAGGKVLLGDSPAFGSLRKAVKANGYEEMMREVGVTLLPFEESRVVKTGNDGPLHEIEIAGEVLDCDVVINLPKIKTHGQMFLTMAVKNLFGCVVGRRKAQWHLEAGKNYEHFARMLAHIARACKPALNILDGVVAMEGNGPNSGTPRETNLVAASTDPVALDVVITNVLGFETDAMNTTRAAREIGWSATELDEIEIIGESIDDVRVADFKTARKRDLILPLPAFAKQILRRLFTTRPRIDRTKCRLCKKCVDICPPIAMTIKKGRVKIDFGRCIRCFCCQEACPDGAIDVKEGLLSKMLRR